MTNTQEKRTALDAFIEHKARIDEMLERLQAASADHFETNPEDIRWGDAGFLADIAGDCNTSPTVFSRRVNMPKTTQQQIDQLLTEIAKKHLNLETLETQNSDSLDFHDVAVWSLKDALQEAYEAGKARRG